MDKDNQLKDQRTSLLDPQISKSEVNQVRLSPRNTENSFGHNTSNIRPNVNNSDNRITMSMSMTTDNIPSIDQL